MWSRKATALAGCGGFLALSGLVLLNYLFISVGIVMLSFLFLASFLSLWMPRVTIERTTSSQNIFEEGELEISFRLRNRGLLGGFVEIYDEIPPQARLVRGSNYTLLYLKRQQEVSLTYVVQVPLRGHYHIGPVRLRVKDAFDLFYTERHEKTLEPFSVFPRIEALDSEILAGKNPKLYQGAMPIYSVGEGTQFYSLRDFLPGDSLRKVNWKAVARTGELMVNETEREDILDIFLLLDARGVSGLGSPTDNPLEMCCRAAASFADQLLRSRNNVGLIVYGSRTTTVHLGRGDTQLHRILTALADAKAEGELPLKLVIQDLLPYIPSGSPIILFSALDNDDTLPDAFTLALTRGYALTVVSPSSIELDTGLGRFAPHPETSTEVRAKLALAQKTAHMERENTIAELRSWGVYLGDWKPGDAVNLALAGVKR